MATWIHSEDGTFSGFDIEEVVGYIRELKTDSHGFLTTTYVILLRGGHRLPIADEAQAVRMQHLIQRHFERKAAESVEV